MLKKSLLLIALAVLFIACLPAQQPAADVQDQVNTAVAGTIQAQERIDLAVELTVTAKDSEATGDTAVDLDSNVVLQASATPEPTFTPFVIPTFTPTATLIPLKYTCSVVKKKPKDNAIFNKGEKFDAKFIITNTGTRPWQKGVDFKYSSGTVLATTRVEIPIVLQPGQSYEVELDGKAPDKKGYYVMSLIVDGPMCMGYLAINVK